MKAIKCSPPSIQIIENANIPVPQTNETLIKINMAGICRTDLELTRGYMGFEGILGHEFVGQLDNGQRVVGEINAGCGQCPMCYQGLQRHCPNRSVLGILNRDGCMAEYITLPNENILEVPDTIEDQKAVFIEPLAAALEIFEQILVPPDAKVCILGDGKLGLLIAMAFAFNHPGETLLVGRHQKKLEVVADLIDTCLQDDEKAQKSKSWDFIVEATGSSGGLRSAMNLVKPRGTIVLKSTMAEAEALDLTPLVIDEIAVVGSRCGQFAPAIKFLDRHPLPLHRLIEGIFPLSEAKTAWDQATKRGAKKVLLEIT